MSSGNVGRNPPALVMEVPRDNWVVRIDPAAGVLGDCYTRLAPEYWGLEGINRLWGLAGAASWQSVHEADGIMLDPMFVPRLLMSPGHRPRQGDLVEHLTTTLMAYSLAMTEVREQGPNLPVWEPPFADEPTLDDNDDEDLQSHVSVTSTTPSAYERAMVPGFDPELARVMNDWGGLALDTTEDDDDRTTISDRSDIDLFSDEDEQVVILLPPPPPRRALSVPVLYIPPPSPETPPPDYTSD